MKAIQLTEEHRIKLLEMCKELFSDYEFEMITNAEELENGILGTKKGDKIELFHWFEFCITHLCDKIFLPRGESRLDGIKGMEYYRINENMHLVDYLYSEFKKLKI